MQDFGTLSSKTVTEVLMLEMKMAPTAKTYLVSGYPRSMRDVAEYSDKIQTITGVILVSWRQRVLERQIEYGARLGHVVLSLARMELSNFYKHVMPVADFFDQTNMLIAVNGERNPEDVYKDFRAAVLQILGTQDDQTTINGVSGVGVGAGGIPGEIVGVEPAPGGLARGLNHARDGREEATALPIAAPVVVPPSVHHYNSEMERLASPKPEIIRVRGAATKTPMLWVVGGPGSNKATLCQRAVSQQSHWTHFSLGQRLRALADAGGGPASDGALSRTAVSGGELAPQELVTKLVRAAVTDAARSGHGLVLDGYPRHLEQMEQFETEFHTAPRMVLLDCSKLQLGRGRRDDSVAAFRRRLEVFRELSLPMLKKLDQEYRLVIVDGDTDLPDVQQQFTRVLLEEMEKAEAIAAMPEAPRSPSPPADSTMQQFANAMSRMGNGMANGFANGGLRNGSVPNGGIANGNVGNGFIPNNKVKPMINNSMAKLTTVSQLTHDEVKQLYAQSTGEVAINTHM
ncbi:uncharacterized protein LOC113236692 [Hyposmocoma kahamanoa]|uniref:uncharacterized protein LOC113236692 n=1 Tax=Hyposmocoma kahamanoa TaxID=1477025 RepID=UPI000E6D8E6B|nr:uncharacterized protein LOC113236692 [Hyposmocoma kahamanoa]